jgi:dihydroorotate dehydrogenase (NAD+) catalytic subunit
MIIAQELFGTTFQNPVLLASGTCGYGEEVAGNIDLEQLGGLVTKAVTPEFREGNPAPRVTEFDAGMINSVGLANVGLDAFRDEKLPWLRDRLRQPRILVNVAGRTIDDYLQVVTALDNEDGFAGFELNLSCPNVKEGGAIFSSSPELLAEVVTAVRACTRRPLIVKLAPNVPDIGVIAEAAERAGADGLTLINTIPGLLFDTATRRPLLGAGSGGVSGPAILPVGINAVWQARRRVGLPIIGVGGIRSADDAVQYLLAGASLVQVGTASFADPNAALRVLSGLVRYLRRHRIRHLDELIGAGHIG